MIAVRAISHLQQTDGDNTVHIPDQLSPHAIPHYTVVCT